MSPDKPLAVVVEDDQNLNEAFALALELAGFSVDKISDSRVALDRILARVPNIVTLDMQMPYINGREVLMDIRSQPTLKDVKVIMITASPATVRDESLDRLADVILIKPVTLGQIMDLAKRLIPKDPVEPDAPG